MNPITLPLKRFILIEQCPPEWQALDLYVFRDDAVAFYVGQSHEAFGRVWDHLLGGFKGHSIVGRFMWVNWPASMNFTIELFSSRHEQFGRVKHDLDAAEQALIQQFSPCFNVTHNPHPTPRRCPHSTDRPTPGCAGGASSTSSSAKQRASSKPKTISAGSRPFPSESIPKICNLCLYRDTVNGRTALVAYVDRHTTLEEGTPWQHQKQ